MKSTKVTNILISFAAVFLVALCLIAFIKEELFSTNAVIISSLLVMLLLGAFIISISICLTKKAYQLYLGLMITTYGILFYLMHFASPYTMYQLWPLFLILAGLILVVTGIYKYRKFKFGYGFPAIVLVCMGIWFFLFSFKILKISFTVVATIAGPIFMFGVGIGLILFFFIQQKHKELVIKDDNHGDFADEELEPSLTGK